MKPFLLIALLALTSCHSLTVAPKPVVPKEIAFDASGQKNAGILDFDQTGLFVTPDWIARYDALLKAYSSKLPVDMQVPTGDRSGITQVQNGSAYHVSFKVNSRFAQMRAMDRALH